MISQRLRDEHRERHATQAAGERQGRGPSSLLLRPRVTDTGLEYGIRDPCRQSSPWSPSRAVTGLVVQRQTHVRNFPRSRSAATLARPTPSEPQVGEEAAPPRAEPVRTVEEVQLPAAPGRRGPRRPSRRPPRLRRLEVPEPTAGRLVRLRARLSRSQNSFGKGLLTLLSRERLDEDTWEEIEDTLLVADVGVTPTQELVEWLRTRVKVHGTRTPAELRALLREELVGAHRPDADRSLTTAKHGTAARPSCWWSASTAPARPPPPASSPGSWWPTAARVVLGAADTFRAAAADQLQTWGERVGARDRARSRGRRPGLGRVRRGQGGHRGRAPTSS